MTAARDPFDAAAEELARLDPSTRRPLRPVPANVDPETGEVLDAAPTEAEAGTERNEPANLPAAFYEARRELTVIRQAAHAAARSADAVLGAVLTRTAALVPPLLRLPDPVGVPQTLDYLAGAIGRSGTGKTSSVKVGGRIVEFPSGDDPLTVVPGSGEGLIEAYFAMVEEVDPDTGNKVRVKRQVRRSVFALLDEGQALSELGTRNGSTLFPTIRSMWSGETVGQANASEDRRRKLSAGEYRFSMMAGFQTEYATKLLDDAAGGTPQRFLFVAAEDATVPDEAPPWPGPLEVDPPRSGVLDLAGTVAQEIRGRALARTRGTVTVDPLDAHRDLLRLKTAGLLAILAGRAGITGEDWELAGLVLDASDRVRAGIVEDHRRRSFEAERQSTARTIRRTVAVEDNAHRRAVESMARTIARHVHRDACGGCARRCVSRSVAGRDRDLASIDEALEEATGLGWVELDGTTIRPGKARPV